MYIRSDLVKELVELIVKAHEIRVAYRLYQEKADETEYMMYCDSEFTNSLQVTLRDILQFAENNYLELVGEPTHNDPMGLALKRQMEKRRPSEQTAQMILDAFGELLIDDD